MNNNGTPKSVIARIETIWQKPMSELARINGGMKLELLAKVLEDFIGLYPESELTQLLKTVRSEQQIFLGGQGRTVGSYHISKTESDNLSLLSCREAVRNAYRVIFEEKVHLKNLSAEKRSLLVDQ